jgi:hypothetical protein
MTEYMDDSLAFRGVTMKQNQWLRLVAALGAEFQCSCLYLSGRMAAEWGKKLFDYKIVAAWKCNIGISALEKAIHEEHNSWTSPENRGRDGMNMEIKELWVLHLPCSTACRLIGRE